jgi:hypothetical protein
MSAIAIHAGRKALAHLHRHGLRAEDIAIVPAAAGGPKGLILQALDQWLFGQWLSSAPRKRVLIGASIGAWRMAAACHADPLSAFRRLADIYCEQRYSHQPSAQHVTDVCRCMLEAFLAGREREVLSHPDNRLHILASRSRRLLPATPAVSLHRRRQAVGFAGAMLANLVSRDRLAQHFDRVVFGNDPALPDWLATAFDAFSTQHVRLSNGNLIDALLGSGTLPLVMEPIAHIAGAPAGYYWDGGLIDYHLALPYSRLGDVPNGGLVLYPHFNDHIVPGWFDKPLRWRCRGQHRHWLDNVILVSPSRSFVASLPRGKLPDRKDFAFHGLDHDRRISDWRRAIAESDRLRDAFLEFRERGDLSAVVPL